MKTSEVLALSKPHLAVGWKDSSPWTPGYICYAIANASRCGQFLDEDEIRVKREIASRLYPHLTLGSWLEHEHGIGKDECAKRSIAYYNKLQATRHAWVDSMIAEFQSKGD